MSTPCFEHCASGIATAMTVGSCHNECEITVVGRMCTWSLTDLQPPRTWFVYQILTRSRLLSGDPPPLRPILSMTHHNRIWSLLRCSGHCTEINRIPPLTHLSQAHWTHRSQNPWVVFFKAKYWPSIAKYWQNVTKTLKYMSKKSRNAIFAESKKQRQTTWLWWVEDAFFTYPK